MKIGIDCRLMNETGVGRYIRNLVQELQTIDKTNEYVLFVLPKDHQKFKVQSSKFKVVQVDIRWHSLEEQVKFPQVLKQEELDLMHFPYFSVPVFYNKPFVITIHDLIIHHFSTGKASTLPQPVYQVKRFGYKYVSSQAVKQAKKIIVPLHTVKEDLMQTLKVAAGKIVVTYEGVDDNLKLRVDLPAGKAGSGKLRNKKYFLYVGNAYPHKNLEKMIEAFVALKKEMKDSVQLLLVGKDDYFYKRLKEDVERKKMQDVIFYHNVSDEELSVFYSNALALVSPSVMEGFGLPPLEAMACSCPLLLSDIASFREVCIDTAHYFDPYSLTDIKEKMSLMYNLDEPTRQKYVKKGLERVKDFSWKKMAEETLKIYNSALNA